MAEGPLPPTKEEEREILSEATGVPLAVLAGEEAEVEEGGKATSEVDSKVGSGPDE